MKNLIYGVDKISFAESKKMGIDGLGKTNDTATIYERITNQVIDFMQQSQGLSWRKPWQTNSNGDLILPENFSTKKKYRGINAYFLQMVIGAANYKNPYFMTYKQAESIGGKVNEGAKSVPVVFYTQNLYRNKADNKTITRDKYLKLPKSIQDAYEPSWTLQSFNVFHASQISGIDFGNDFVPVSIPEVKRIENCEKILEEAPNLPSISFGGSEAFYSYSETSERIQVPNIYDFDSAEFFYSVLFHEIIHSTGSTDRLNRLEKKKRKNWGDSYYAYEELIAEMGAAYLDGVAGIEYKTLKNSAEYLVSWKKKVINELKNDPKFFFNACGDAQKASDYVLGNSTEEIYSKFKGQKNKISIRTKIQGTDISAKAQAQRIRILKLKLKINS